MAEPDTERPTADEPCQQLACPFEAALQRLHDINERRIRSEQNIVENLDRLADKFQAAQRETHDNEQDILGLRRDVDSMALDVIAIRAAQHATHRTVHNVKYWLAAIVTAITIAAPIVQHVLGGK